jgi:nodulation protein E
MQRIVITGMGVISALGHDLGSFREALLAGTSGIAPIALFDASDFQAKIAAEVKGFDPTRHFSPNRLGLLDRYAQFALVAARQAVRDSGVDFAAEGLAHRSGVFHGTGIGGQTTQDENYRRLYGEKKSRLNPNTVPRLIPSSAASQLTLEFGIKGPGFATASACSAAGHAIATAVVMLRSGLIDAALAGGSEAFITPGGVRGWEALRILAGDTCRPFSKGRTGTVLGEGSGMVVLETLERARGRGARIHAELLGVGLSSDAFHAVQPECGGIARAIRAALDDARLRPEQVDYINAHGTATPQNDPVETAAIRQVFGAQADKLAVSSTKSLHGHTLGAASAIELVAAVVALQEQCAPPTANYLEPDPECDLDYVPNAARPLPMACALSHSFAFGGLNVVLALGHPDGVA